MLASRFPKVEQQFNLYKQVLEAVPGEVTFRTLDIGGDKILPYMRTYEEENPALGWRALRIGLDRPGLLRLQLRSLLLAGAGRDLRIMFPMVTMASEFDAAKAIVEREVAHLNRHKYEPPKSLSLGVMIEVPALLWQLDEILERVDFLSVGSNDLVQYLTAADRDNRRVANRFDALSAPVLRALASVPKKARAYGKPVTLCGEMGGRPLEALTLIALGYRGLSMSATSVGPVKAAILAADAGDFTQFVETLLEERSGAASLREKLRAYADAKGVPL
jgi:phosphotransferase system enzyme I (PtsP)